MSKSLAEERFTQAWEAVQPSGGEPCKEYRFHPSRLWRFDFAWPKIRIAVEIDGRGRHQTVVGFRQDCEKVNEAIRLGWRVLRFPATDYKQADAWAATVIDVITSEHIGC